MTDKELYFTPDIEDIRVGYECEMYRGSGTGWEKVVIDTWMDRDGDGDIPDAIYALGKNQWRRERSEDLIRVPYLTKEQIEAEGWEALPDKSPFTGKQYKFRKTKEFGFNELHTWTLEALHGYPVKIHLEWESSWNRFNDYIFQGQCKDINTFRYICKLLNI